MTDPLATARRIRRLGIVQLIAGLFLIGMMGAITVKMYPSMSHPGVADLSGTTFTGTAEQAHQALQLFGLVIALGIVAALTGVWQIATGRRSMIAVALAVVLGGALYFSARGFLPN